MGAAVGVRPRGGLAHRDGAGHEDGVAHVLDDAAGGLGELLARHPLLAERVRELLRLEDQRARAEAVGVVVGDDDAVGEVAGHLGLDGGHHLELGAAAAAARAEDGELLGRALRGEGRYDSRSAGGLVVNPGQLGPGQEVDSGQARR